MKNVAFLLSQTAGGRSMLRPYSAHKHFFIGHFYFDTPSPEEWPKMKASDT